MNYQIFAPIGAEWRPLDAQAWPTKGMALARLELFRRLEGLRGKTFQLRFGKCAELRAGGGVVLETFPPEAVVE